jgi:hypothetical protein
VRRAAVRTAHLTRLGHLVGLNAVRGLYFRAERGRIIEAKGYRTPDDGDPHEVLACILRVMQRLGFNDDSFLKGISNATDPKVRALVDAMLSGKEVPGASVWGDWRQRFSETQILQAVSSTLASQISGA